MRQLVVVSISADGTRLLLAPTAESRATHEVVVDDRIQRAVRGVAPDPAAPQISALSPKEIQARLRGGASVEDVAAEAGVTPSRIERYAGPVRSERENVLTAIRAMNITRARTGTSALPLGAAVDANLAGMAFARVETATWSAYRRADGAWVGRLEVVVRDPVRDTSSPRRAGTKGARKGPHKGPVRAPTKKPVPKRAATAKTTKAATGSAVKKVPALPTPGTVTTQATAKKAGIAKGLAKKSPGTAWPRGPRRTS